MTVYDNAEQLYRCVRRAFELVEPRHFDPLHQGRLVIYFICENPTAELVIDGRTIPVQTYFGTNSIPPTLTIWLESDTLHRIMLGELGIVKALGQNKIKAKGPLLKARALADLFNECQKIYPEILQSEDPT